MSTSTTIEWTRSDDGSAGATWNPVTGCSEVSEGCDNCYAKTFAERWRGIPGHPFEQGFDVRLWPDRIGLPLRWRKSKRVFVNSMSDLWHETVPDEFIAAVWTTMFWTSAEGRPGSSSLKPRHTYQLLTKRSGRMRSWVRRWGNQDQRVAWIETAAERGWCGREDVAEAPGMPAVLPNAWLGVSAETQRWAKVRLPLLAETPAVVRFASCEPLLGALDIRPWLDGGLDWVIAGGESGPKARPMHPDWARGLRDQCEAAGVPFFFKQWGQFAPESVGAWLDSDGSPRGGIWVLDGRGRSWTRTPLLAPTDAVRMRRVGKGRAGRELDGRTWDAFPRPGAEAGVAGG